MNVHVLFWLEKSYFLLKPRMIAPQGQCPFIRPNLLASGDGPQQGYIEFVKMMNDQQQGIFPPFEHQKIVKSHWITLKIKDNPLNLFDSQLDHPQKQDQLLYIL